MNSLRRSFDSLANRDFRWLWFGSVLSFFPFQMSQVARGYLAYEVGGVATAIAIVSLGWGLPQLLMAPVGGLLADRLPKRAVLMGTQLVLGACALITGLLVVFQVVEIWQLFLLGVVQGTAFTINLPARQSFPAMIVGEQRITNAVAMTNLASNVTRIVGPSLAGAIIAIAFLGLPGVFFLATAFNLGAFLLLMLVRNPGAPEAGAAKEPRWKAMTAGFRFIAASPRMITLVSLAFFPVMLSATYILLMPVIAKDVFGVGPDGLGLMFTFSGLGAIAGSLLAASLSSVKRKSLIQLIAGSAFGVAIVVFSQMPIFPLALVALIGMGLCQAIFQAMNSSLILLSTPKALYGRVMAVYGLTFALMPLVQVPVAALADWVGVQMALTLAGVLITIFVLGVTVFNPSYRRSEFTGTPKDQPGAAAPAPATAV